MLTHVGDGDSGDLNRILTYNLIFVLLLTNLQTTEPCSSKEHELTCNFLIIYYANEID